MGSISACIQSNEVLENMDTMAEDDKVDEKLYSRQLYVMGYEAQRRMMSSKALVVGLSGLGVEVSKNCILAGISSLVLLDPNPPNSYDLGGNFYLKEADIGGKKSRAELSLPSLSELNPYVNVTVAQGVKSFDENDETAILNLIRGTTCVVVTIPLRQDLLKKINHQCRTEKSCFIYGTVMSVFSQIFCDFGESFVVSDVDGEQPATSQVESVIPTSPVVVKVLEDHGRHGLESGDLVTFARVKELPSLNGNQFKVKVTGPYTFELEENEITRGISTSVNQQGACQGYITQVKQPKVVSFMSYEEALSNHDQEFMLSDYSKFDRPPLLFLAFKAMSKYQEAHNGELPPPNDVSAANEFVGIANAMDINNILSAGAQSEDSLHLLKKLAHGCRAVLSPMCAFLGGFVGQEVLKACSGKFMPIRGFFFFDAAESLPVEPLTENEISIDGKSRYDSQIIIFGRSLQDKLSNLNYFLVGAGAIGCEMLKNWAMMGVGCGQSGCVFVTDMDNIEKSNLSRQFLFRNNDIGKFKSSTAANAAKAMNKNLHIVAYQEKVAAATEDLFGDVFFDQLDGVCTALDNIEARLYVDQRCLFYRIPMLESGTLGTKGNTQVVVPHLTENYGATRDPPEKSIPVCTLKNFPNQIQHTLQWARDHFEGVFKQSAEDVNAYLSSGEVDFIDALSKQSNKNDTLKNIHRTLVVERPRGFDDCIIWARLKFEELFNSQIKQLLHNFPEDQLTSTGQKFWSGSKRCPNPITFDPDAVCEDAEMANHFDFVIAAANLRAQMFGLKGTCDRQYFKQVLANTVVPEFTPKDGIKIAANEDEAKEDNSENMMDVDDEADKLLADLPKPSSLAGFRLHPIEFDKDIDDHMLYVTACSNLRAINYGIPTEDTHKSRAIAGKIIPAIATTTALVTGLICLELYKLAGTARRQLKIEDFKNGFVNLAIPFMTVSEPQPPVKTKSKLGGKEWEWTSWDSLDILEKGDITMREFMEHFKKEYNLEISMLSQGVSILYSFFANKQKIAERMMMPMSDVVRSVTKRDIPTSQRYLIFEIIANDLDTDEEVELPYVKFRFR